ncbi:MAG: Lrp/AsnC family transcriptional regulator [Verrucomicrobiae bacterium]|nr:Lrp/AsnC family transcriptional regulator [Verrucomicrobiae bacterium]
MSGLALDAEDRALLSALQTEVPVVARPWLTIGVRVGLDEDQVMERVLALKQAGIVRQISAIFDTPSLGYRSSLVACRCAPEREEEVAAIINSHPGVSHNYRREHPFNLWFTLAASRQSRLGLEGTVERLARLSGATSMRLLPTLRLFKIGVRLDVSGEDSPLARDEGGYRQTHRQTAQPLTEEEIRYVREMQGDLPVVPMPFVGIAERLGMSLDRLQAMTEAMRTRGRLRRISAVLRHREAGFRANGMAVWVVPGGDEEVKRVGELLASVRAVTHCYQRPTYPDWPYNLFTMIHARSREECEAIVAGLAKMTGLDQYAVLYSTREYKKVRVPYFTEAEAEWETQHG